MLNKDRFLKFIESLQNDLCRELEDIDGEAKFREDAWQRPGGGGGHTRILDKGAVIEKAGINRSAVHGQLSAAVQKQLNTEYEQFFACGISLVIHPLNPHAPTCHANFRYFELYDGDDNIVDQWYGGGLDLTPYYLYEEDALHFHRLLQERCLPYGKNIYTRYKLACDAYFYNSHRGEARGVGGLFFDYLKPKRAEFDWDVEDFTMAIGNSFAEAYYPILRKRTIQPYDNKQKYWQEIRRGRYVEFNLLHDKGTLFGIRTNGRTESILMSLPPTVRWDYDFCPAEGSPEAHLLNVLRQPKTWI